MMPVLLLITSIVMFITSGGALGQSAAQSKTKPNMSLYTIDCGLLFMRNADVYDSLGRMKGINRALANPCYLIQHGSDYMLWDTGLADILATSYARVSTPINPTPTEAQFDLQLSGTLVSKLAVIHLKPSDVKFVGIPQNTLDHTGNLKLFPQSTLLIDELEYKAMFGQRRKEIMVEFYGAWAWNGDDEAAKRMNKILIPHAESYDVFRDGTVVMYPAPGHSVGGRVLLVRMPQSGTYLLTGDVWVMKEVRQYHAVQSHDDPSTAKIYHETQDNLERLAMESRAKVVLSHEFDDFFQMPAFPKALH